MNNAAIRVFLLLRDTPDSLVKELVVPTRKFVKHKRVGVTGAHLYCWYTEVIIDLSLSLGDRRMYAQ